MTGSEHTRDIDVKFTIVDSIPKSVAPPSRIGGLADPNKLITCSALVGLVRLEDLHLGCQRNSRQSSIDWKWVFEGERRPTVFRVAVTIPGTISFLFRIIVRGPGQNSLASFIASSQTSAYAVASWMFWMCKMTGFTDGLPLSLKIFSTADCISPFAANP